MTLKNIVTFNNGDLDKDIERHLRADEIEIVCDTMDNGEGEIMYMLDVNDDGYFYHNKRDRDDDHKTLTETIQLVRK